MSTFRFHFLVPECSLSGKTNSPQDHADFRDHGLSTPAEHAQAMSLSDAGSCISPEAEAALTRLVGLEMLGECDLLIPTPSPHSESETTSYVSKRASNASGTSDNPSRSPQPRSPGVGSLRGPANSKREREEEPEQPSPPDRREQGHWLSTLTGRIFGKNKRRKESN